MDNIKILEKHKLKIHDLNNNPTAVLYQLNLKKYSILLRKAGFYD